MTKYILYRDWAVPGKQLCVYTKATTMDEVREFAKKDSRKSGRPINGYVVEIETRKPVFTPEECKDIENNNIILDYGVYT